MWGAWETEHEVGATLGHSWGRLGCQHSLLAGRLPRRLAAATADEKAPSTSRRWYEQEGGPQELNVVPGSSPQEALLYILVRRRGVRKHKLGQ